VRQALLNALAVAAGGAVGSLCRYGCSLLLQRQSLVYPAGTLASNWGGCFVIGCLAQLLAPSPLLSTEVRLLLVTGFCGGFTTMSSLVYELGQFLRDGEYWHAAGYLLMTLVGCVLLFAAGAGVVKMAFRTTGGIWN